MRYHYFARKNELLLDIDNRKAIKTFLRYHPIIAIVAKKVVQLNTRPDHLHVYIILSKRLSYNTLFSLAGWLGSDLRRESANYSRLISGAKKPALLIEYQRVPDFREPDLVCSCPRNYLNTKKKMPSCEHLISFKEFHFKEGTLWNQVRKLGFPDISV